MRSPIRIVALCGALAAHGAALAVVQSAIVQTAAREHMAHSQPPRIVVRAPARALVQRGVIARQSCSDAQPS